MLAGDSRCSVGAAPDPASRGERRFPIGTAAGVREIQRWKRVFYPSLHENARGFPETPLTSHSSVDNLAAPSQPPRGLFWGGLAWTGWPCWAVSYRELTGSVVGGVWGFPLWAVSSGPPASGRLGAMCCALSVRGGSRALSGRLVGPAHCCQDLLWFLL